MPLHVDFSQNFFRDQIYEALVLYTALPISFLTDTYFALFFVSVNPTGLKCNVLQHETRHDVVPYRGFH